MNRTSWVGGETISISGICNSIVVRHSRSCGNAALSPVRRNSMITCGPVVPWASDPGTRRKNVRSVAVAVLRYRPIAAKLIECVTAPIRRGRFCFSFSPGSIPYRSARHRDEGRRQSILCDLVRSQTRQRRMQCPELCHMSGHRQKPMSSRSRERRTSVPRHHCQRPRQRWCRAASRDVAEFCDVRGH
jgi:hypothetical protein